MSYERSEIIYETPEQQKELAAQAPMLLDSYKRDAKANAIRLLTDAEVKTLYASRMEDAEDKGAIAKAERVFQGSDFGKFENLKMGAVAYQCTQLFYSLRETYGDAGLTMDNPLFREYALKNIQNPFFRLSMEMAANTRDLEPKALRESCRSTAIAMNEQMMLRTLAVPSEEQRANLAQALGSTEKAESEIAANRLTQMTLAKTMFLSHLGSFHVVKNDGTNERYQGSLTETMAHGGRTAFYFSKGEPGAETIEQNLFHDIRPDGDRGRAVQSRAFATHAVKSGPEEEGVGAYREKSAVTDVSDNYGMNTAVGGLGNYFGNKVMRNDGKNGHYYIKMKESTAKKGGYLMVGMEGSETLERGKTGRLHFGGGSSMASAFISGKGAPGKKLDGRLVDLSIWNHKVLGAMLRKFNAVYGGLQDRAYGNGADARQAAEQLDRINQKLSGKMMNGFVRNRDGSLQQDDLSDFLRNEMGIESIVVDGKNVEVSQLAEYRAYHGSRNFDALNEAKEKRQPVSRREDEYVPSANFDKLAKELAQARRYVLGKEKQDSPEMRAVKEALDQTLLLVHDADIGANPGAMNTQLKVLQEKTRAYLSTRSANNLRRQIVSRIDALAGRELSVTDRFIRQEKAARSVKPVGPQNVR